MKASNTRAVGILAAMTYLQDRKPKKAPPILLQHPCKLPASALFRLFSKVYGYTLNKEGEVTNG